MDYKFLLNEVRISPAGRGLPATLGNPPQNANYLLVPPTVPLPPIAFGVPLVVAPPALDSVEGEQLRYFDPILTFRLRR